MPTIGTRGPTAVFVFALASAACLLVQTGQAQEVKVSSEPARLFVEENSVIATDAAGNTMWRIPHMSVSNLVPRQGDLVQIGGFRYYAYHCYLMEVDPAKGVVVKRTVFPGRIIEFASKGGTLTVIVELPAGDAYKKVPFGYGPGHSNMVGLPIDQESVSAPMKDAQALIPGFSFLGFQYEYRREKALPIINRGVLDEAFRRNPTNPWFMFFKGMILSHLGRHDEARVAFSLSTAVDGAPAFDHLRMSSVLAYVGETGESIIAFERGFASFVRSGLEPEQLMSKDAFKRYFAVQLKEGAETATSHAEAIQAAAKAGDSCAMMTLVEHGWRLAPRCEGIAYSFSGVAEYLQEQGRAEEASVWFARARRAASFSGPVGTRQAMYGAAACLVALMVMFLVIAGRSFKVQKQDLAPIGGWLASWRWPKERFSRIAFAYAGRLELFGILLVASAGFALSYLVITQQRSVLQSLALPEEVKAGTWGHHNAVATFENYRGDAGRLLYAIACQQADQTKDAKDEYEKLSASTTPAVAAIALNNLGVIQVKAGEPIPAGDSFKKSLAKDPGLAEALYNQGEAVDSRRVSRSRAYRPGEPMIALPDASILAAAFASAPSTGETPTTPDDGLGVFRVLSVWVIPPVTVIFGVMSLLFMLIRRKPEVRSEGSVLGWLAYVVPWTSVKFAPLGGLLLGSWIYCLITIVQVMRTQFGSVLSSPALGKQIYGLSGSIVFPFESAIAFGGPVALIGLWVLNFLVLARTGAKQRASKTLQESETIVVVRPASEAGAAKGKPKAAPDAGAQTRPAKSRDSSRATVRSAQAKSGEAKPEPKKPEPQKAEAPKPKAAEPKAVEPEAIEPEAIEPDDGKADDDAPPPEAEKPMKNAGEKPVPASGEAKESASSVDESPEIQDGAGSTDSDDEAPVD